MTSFLGKVGKVTGASAVAGGIKSVASSLSGRPQARAIRDAAKLQVGASERAMETIKGLADRSRADLSPWVSSGNRARETLDSLLLPGGALTQNYRGGADYTAQPFNFDVNSDPGAQFRMDTANRALSRSSAATGRSMGGRAIQNVLQLNQALASDEFGKSYDRYNTDRNYGLTEYSTNRNFFNQDKQTLFNQLFGISGQGQASAAGQAAQGTQLGSQLSDLLTGVGNVQAGSLVGQANAKAGGIQNVLNLLLQGGTAAAALL
jgi:hypothetical protein